ncbi:unnamed protein product [Amoebophrya sp. A25]|nr:unnamed protein product [Amoebophrya sp. A25]|eukprot:GSA25T00021692001.1
MFGSAVKLGQLSDYLDSNQECIQPLLSGGKIKNEKQDGRVYDLSRGMSTERPDLIKKAKAESITKRGSTSGTGGSGADNANQAGTTAAPLTKKEKAVVALSDCLACSGCVTSAEAVLLETQSFDQFLKVLNGGTCAAHGLSATDIDELLFGAQVRPSSVQPRDALLPKENASTPTSRQEVVSESAACGLGLLSSWQYLSLFDAEQIAQEHRGTDSLSSTAAHHLHRPASRPNLRHGQKDLVVMSVSPESLVNLHLRWNPDGLPIETLGKLQRLLRMHAGSAKGVVVTDTGVAHAIYVRKILAEVDHVIQDSKTQACRDRVVDITAPASSDAVTVLSAGASGTTKTSAPGESLQDFVKKVQNLDEGLSYNNAADRAKERAKPPLVASYCPGWTCYAEKVAPPAVAPHLSSVRNPLVIQGHLVKTRLATTFRQRAFLTWYRTHFPSLSLAPHQDTASTSFIQPGTEDIMSGDAQSMSVSHILVAPCFDRKIETMRPEFGKTLDLVLATRELEQLLHETQLPLAFVEKYRAATAADPVAVASLWCEDFNNDDETVGDSVVYARKLQDLADIASSDSRTRRRAEQRIQENSHGVGGDRYVDFFSWVSSTTKSYVEQGRESLFGETDKARAAALRRSARAAEWEEMQEDERLARAFFRALPADSDICDALGNRMHAVERHLNVDEAMAYSRDSEDYLPVRLDRNLAQAADGTLLRASGFKNIQNVVAKLVALHKSDGAKTEAMKPSVNAGQKSVGTSRQTSLPSQKANKSSATSAYDFMDVAACPGGCLNGGGQFPLGKNGLEQMQAFWRDLPLRDVGSTTAASNLDDPGSVHYRSLRTVDEDATAATDRGKAGPTLKW